MNFWNQERFIDHEPGIKCGSCDRIFAKKYELEVHMKHDNRTTEHFHCDFCDKTFVLKWRKQIGKEITLFQQ